MKKCEKCEKLWDAGKIQAHFCEKLLNAGKIQALWKIVKTERRLNSRYGCCPTRCHRTGQPSKPCADSCRVLVLSNQHFTELRIANVDKRYALRATRPEDQVDIRETDGENDARGTCLLESYVACYYVATEVQLSTKPLNLSIINTDDHA